MFSGLNEVVCNQHIVGLRVSAVRVIDISCSLMAGFLSVSYVVCCFHVVLICLDNMRRITVYVGASGTANFTSGNLTMNSADEVAYGGRAAYLKMLMTSRALNCRSWCGDIRCEHCGESNLPCVLA